MAASTLGNREGDFVVHMESRQKCLHYGQVKMPASGGPHSLSDVVAYPIKANNVLAVAGEEANVIGFVVAGDAISGLANDAVTSGAYYTLLTRFDGVVLNDSVLPAKDCKASPGTFNKTNLKAATGLANVKWVSEPTNTTTQED